MINYAKCKRGPLAGSRVYEKQKTFKTNLNVERVPIQVPLYALYSISSNSNDVKLPLSFWQTQGENIPNQQFDSQSNFRPESPQICGKSALELHVAFLDPAELSHDLAEEQREHCRSENADAEHAEPCIPVKCSGLRHS